MLRAYVMRLFALRTLAAAAVLTAIFQILDLLDVTTDILERDLGVEGVLRYAALRLPILVRQVAPLAVLIGGIFTFAQLARENAVVALRGAGLSIYWLVLAAAPVAMAVVALNFAIIEVVGPRAQFELDRWWTATAPPEPEPVAPAALSFRTGQDLVIARPEGDRGDRLSAVSVYRRDDAGLLTERITAASAVFADGAWLLSSVSTTRVAQTGVTTAAMDRMTWPIPLLPVDVLALSAPDSAVSPAAARRALAGGGADQSLAFYRTQLQRSFAEPLGAVVMLLLAAPVAVANFRSARAIRMLSASLAAGLVYLIVDGVFTALGQTGTLPGVVAAWSGSLVFAAAGVTALLYLEG